MTSYLFLSLVLVSVLFLRPLFYVTLSAAKFCSYVKYKSLINREKKNERC